VSSVQCVTVTYGATPTLLPMLESLHRTTIGVGLPVEMTLMIQPDADGVTAIADLAHLTDWVDVIELRENIGFGPANNLGVERSRSPYIALLNPDLELVEGWLEPLIGALEGDESIAIAAPPLLTTKGDLEEAGATVDAEGVTTGVGGNRSEVPYDDAMRERDVTYASAACWLVRRSAFETIGGFDPLFVPAYYEDVDLALRLADVGNRCRLVPRRPVVHHHRGPDAGRVAIAERSRQLFGERWAARLAEA
jgi:GT2 family glycosyltransferase